MGNEINDLRKNQFELLRLISDLSKEDEWKVVSLSKIVLNDSEKRDYEVIQSIVGRLMKKGLLTRPFWGIYKLTSSGESILKEITDSLTSNKVGES